MNFFDNLFKENESLCKIVFCGTIKTDKIDYVSNICKNSATKAECVIIDDNQHFNFNKKPAKIILNMTQNEVHNNLLILLMHIKNYFDVKAYGTDMEIYTDEYILDLCR